MSQKEELFSKLNRLTKRSNRLFSLNQLNNKLIWATKKQLAEAEFGKIGSEISIKYNDQIITAIIVSFQDRFWNDMPFCIVKMVLNGTEVETHLTDGDSIIKQTVETL